VLGLLAERRSRYRPPDTPAGRKGNLMVIERIDELVREHHLLRHPFYTKWVAGTLPMEALQEYARQYFAFESTFPRFLSALHSRTERPELRAAILDNLWDEEHGSSNHAELWLRFAEGIGVTREDVAGADRNEATRDLVAVYTASSNELPVAAGIAALYAYESQVPDVAKAKIDGLKRNYGVDDERTLAFFETHAYLDEDHADQERTIVEELAPGVEDVVVGAAEDAVKAWWRFLDAVDPGE
jgi:pyrroloquinoline-quinone synthase